MHLQKVDGFLELEKSSLFPTVNFLYRCIHTVFRTAAERFKSEMMYGYISEERLFYSLQIFNNSLIFLKLHF